jgi:hypothetical protein
LTLKLNDDILHGDVTTKRKRELLDLLGGLAEHGGWAYIALVLQQQADDRYLAIGRQVPTSLEDILTQAALRGEAMGMEVLKELPQYLIATLEADLSLIDSNQPQEIDLAD